MLLLFYNSLLAITLTEKWLRSDNIDSTDREKDEDLTFLTFINGTNSYSAIQRNVIIVFFLANSTMQILQLA